MIIPTATILIVNALIFSWIAFTNPEPCPRKYRSTTEKGGLLVNAADIHRYWELDYGGKFVLKANDEIEGIIDTQNRLKD